MLYKHKSSHNQSETLWSDQMSPDEMKGYLLPLALHLHLVVLLVGGAVTAEAGQGGADHAHLAVVSPDHFVIARGLGLFPAPMYPAKCKYYCHM